MIRSFFAKLQRTNFYISVGCSVLFWFEASSGLKINLDKRKMYKVGEVDNLVSLAAVLVCQTGQLPSTY